MRLQALAVPSPVIRGRLSVINQRPPDRQAAPRFGLLELVTPTILGIVAIAGMIGFFNYREARVKKALAKRKVEYLTLVSKQGPSEQYAFFNKQLTKHVPSFSLPYVHMWVLKTLPQSPLPFPDKTKLLLTGLEIGNKHVTEVAEKAAKEMIEQARFTHPAVSGLLKQLVSLSPGYSDDFDNGVRRDGFPKAYFAVKKQVLAALAEPKTP